MTTTNNAINNNIANSVFSSLQVALDGDYIADSFGNPVLSIGTAGASSVNYVVLQNNITGNSPKLTATGSDSNISLTLNSKGTAGVPIKGISDATSATAGYVGQFVTSNVQNSSPVTVTTGMANNLTSISLTAGDWDVWGNVLIFATTITSFSSWISTSSATVPDFSLINYNNPNTGSTAVGIPAPQIRINISSTTTVYLSCYPITTGTTTASGTLSARRVR